MDAIEQLAQRQIVIASADIEAELNERSGTVLLIWRVLRKNASASLAQLATLNVHDHKDRVLIVTHQNEVKRYAEFVNAMKAILDEGKEIAERLSTEEWRDIAALIRAMPEAEQPRIEMGLRDDDIDPPTD